MVMVPETSISLQKAKEPPGPKATPLTLPLENITDEQRIRLVQTASTILNTLEAYFFNPTLPADIKTLEPRVEEKQKQGKTEIYPVQERQPISATEWPQAKVAAARLTNYAANSEPKMELLHFALIQAAQGNDIPRTPSGGFDLEALKQQFSGQGLPETRDPNPQASTSTPAGIERLVAHTIDKFILPDLEPITAFGKVVARGQEYNPSMDLSLDYVRGGSKAVQNNLELIKRALRLIHEGKQIPTEGYHGVINIPAMRKIQEADRLDRKIPFATMQEALPSPALVPAN